MIRKVNHLRGYYVHRIVFISERESIMHSLRHTLITALVAFGLMGPTAALAYANPEQKAKRIGTSVQAKSVKQRGKDVSWGMATTVVHAPLHVVEGIILD